MHDRSDVACAQINRQISLSRCLIRVIHAGESLDFSIACLLIDPSLVCRFTVLKWRSNMNEEKTAVLLYDFAGLVARSLEWRDWRCNDGGASFR
jgi:hypothetical protein